MSTIEIVVIEANRLEAAWQWLVSSLSPRPEEPSDECIYDHKVWRDGICEGPLVTQDRIPQFLGDLYLASQLCFEGVIGLVNNGIANDVVHYGASLDADLTPVVSDDRRFRNHLSEHLSCWVRLAIERKTSQAAKRFAHTQPNIQPEDKGPDGLFLLVPESGVIVELLSVKNSTGPPQQLVSSRPFREGGEADGTKRPAMLEEFFLIASGKKVGLTRLDNKLSEACSHVGFKADQRRRQAWLLEKSYNGVVVADDQYAKQEMFSGFRYVHCDPTKCIGTYIGSQCWAELAEAVRQHVLGVLKNKGLM